MGSNYHANEKSKSYPHLTPYPYLLYLNYAKRKISEKKFLDD